MEWKWSNELNCFCAKHNNSIRADINGNVFGGGTTKTTNEATQQATPTAEETAMEKLQLAQYKAFEPSQTEMYNNAFALGNQLLTSFGDKSGQQWQQLIGGITPQQNQSMINTQDRTLQGSFNQSGIYDSGTSASGRLRSAADLSNQNAQFNVGTLQNALNLALSGQAQVQSPAQGASSQLASQLAGLRTQTGTSTQTSNPFLNSFYSSLGKTMGGGNSTGTGGAMGFFGFGV
jgi:hypothetical protein